MAERGRPKARLEVGDEERAQLESWARRRTSAQALAQRSRIVLGCAGGETNQAVAERERVSPATVGKWRRRFVERRLDGLVDEPRPGRPRAIGDAQVEDVLVRTLESEPKDATHWSTRSMAAASGLSRKKWTVQRCHGQPRPSDCSRTASRRGSCPRIRCSSTRSATSSAFTSPRPSAPWCSAWMRSRRSRRSIGPPRSCRCARGCPSARPTTTSGPGPPASAALDVTTGKVIHALRQRHRAIEFKKFLQQIDREVPDHLSVHLVLDNASTHKTPQIKRWLAAHPRFVLHFTPSSSSWLNLVERWFSELTTKKLQRGAHRSVPALHQDIRAWITDLERRSQALHLDQDRRPDPRLRQPLLHPAAFCYELTCQDTSYFPRK